MPDTEPRYACPVCLGVSMTKLRLVAQGNLVLDHCQRCGGIWFDAEEIPRLRQYHPQVLQRHITLHDEQYRMTCHACFAKMPRNALHCPACQWRNVIDCPVCTHALHPVERQGLQLDLCQSCKGVWFDNIELAELWNRQLASFTSQHPPRAPHAAVMGDGASLFLEVMAWSSVDMMASGLQAGAQGGQTLIEVTAQGLSNVPDGAGAVVEGTSDLAASVFETIAGIIGEIFG